MPAKKKAPAAPEAAEDTRELRAARPGDPTYQMPARASEEDLAVLSQGPDARAAALLADLKRMGAR